MEINALELVAKIVEQYMMAIIRLNSVLLNASKLYSTVPVKALYIPS